MNQTILNVIGEKIEQQEYELKENKERIERLRRNANKYDELREFLKETVKGYEILERFDNIYGE